MNNFEARMEALEKKLALAKEDREAREKMQRDLGTHVLVYCGKYANYIIYE